MPLRRKDKNIPAQMSRDIRTLKKNHFRDSGAATARSTVMPTMEIVRLHKHGNHGYIYAPECLGKSFLRSISMYPILQSKTQIPIRLTKSLFL